MESGEKPAHLVFRKMHSGIAVEPMEYVGQMISQYPECLIHVGCDSQNVSDQTVYVTTIVFRFPGCGAHVIYKKERIPRIATFWEKLWGETERSVNLATTLKDEIGVKVQQIDLDFNPDPAYPSHKLIPPSEGYIKSLGFVPKAKPNLLMAVWAANVLCH